MSFFCPFLQVEFCTEVLPKKKRGMEMLEVSRKELDKTLADMGNLFAGTKDILSQYEEQKAAIELREQELKQQLSKLREEQAAIAAEKEANKGNMLKYLTLSKQLSDLENDVQILSKLLSEIDAEFTGLKLTYAPKLKETYQRDLAAKGKLDVKFLVDYFLYELSKGISDYSGSLLKEYRLLMNEEVLDEFLSDAAVLAANAGFSKAFSYEAAQPVYFENRTILLRKENIMWSLSGSMPADIYPPRKEGK